MGSFTYTTVVLLIWVTAVFGRDCPYKECSCSDSGTGCDEMGLDKIPPVINPDGTGLLLSMDTNNITTVPSGSFPEGLKEISLKYNPITTIDDSAFDGSANTLLILSFSGARFTRIPDAFLHLNSLNDLTLSNMNIQDWNVDAMKHIGSTVENLYLEDVGLTTWPDWIQHFSNLKELTIKSSFISSLPDNALHNQTNTLRKLSLMNINLTAIPKAFSELKALEMLDLFNTKVSDLTYLPQASKITSLSLDNTNLADATHVSNMMKPYATSMKKIHLKGNQLDAIPTLSFLTKLGSVVLSHNRISDHNSGSMPSSAYDIDLGYNRLHGIPRMLSSLLSVTALILPSNSIEVVNGIDFHTSVTQVDLGFNLVTELTDTSFPPNASIMILTLSNNPIIKISALAFQNLQRLADLSLENTKLTRLPLALASLGNLMSLDVRNNNDLVCTCLEISLRPLMLKLDDVLGDCGRTSVGDFFGTLSASCPTR